eukprot:TRINITY_DN5000_c0_g1_i1.p1 TRINITY_DN5000_c0_g1~~TRINITY_DN5000_c0_g1_i1.p1  ORF type:complete len:446 (+),score=41.85 TRINITY_DN5000_c0_g1_i1:63-1400(+)
MSNRHHKNDEYYHMYGPHTLYHKGGQTYSTSVTSIFARAGRLLIAPANIFLSHFLIALTRPTGRDRVYRLSPKSPKQLIFALILAIPTLISLIIALPGFVLLGLSNLTRHHFTFVFPHLPFNHESVELPEAIKTQGLRILTFNVGSLPQFISIFNLLRPLHERVGEIIDAINESDYDVICLQELFDEEVIHRFIEEIDRTKYGWIVAGPGRSKRLLYNSGLCIISRYPIALPTFWGYTTRAGDDIFAHKGVLGAHIEVSATQEVIVLTTHLQAGGKNSDQLRQNQLACISHIYDQYATPQNGKTLLGTFTCGDFNIGKYRSKRDSTGNLTINEEWRRSEWFFMELHYLYSIQEQDLTDTAQGHGTVWDMGTAHTGWSIDRVQEWQRKDEWLDHVMLLRSERPPLPGRVDVITDGISLSSDHLAVSATFQISPDHPLDSLYLPFNG